MSLFRVNSPESASDIIKAMCILLDTINEKRALKNMIVYEIAFSSGNNWAWRIGIDEDKAYPDSCMYEAEFRTYGVGAAIFVKHNTKQPDPLVGCVNLDSIQFFIDGNDYYSLKDFLHKTEDLLETPLPNGIWDQMDAWLRYNGSIVPKGY